MYTTETYKEGKPCENEPSLRMEKKKSTLRGQITSDLEVTNLT